MESTFKVQKSYWKDKCNITYNQHLLLTKSLKEELTAIRNKCRAKLPDIDGITKQFKLGEPLDDNSASAFVSLIKDTTIYCTDAMLSLSKRIMTESVDLLTQQPPCSFNAVAIGSLARGEATPYSDLEYMFLVDDKSTEAMQYFENLAITSYFLMGNFRETKLSYMNIDELKGWFDDKAKNGFKIDGLAPGAGNIPTGNLVDKIQNYFIVTPEELSRRYEKILNSPDESALRGDLTSMLTYMKTFYSHGHKATKKTENLIAEIAKIEPSNRRMEVNKQMLKNDLEKFDFSPDSKLHDCGFTVDVKKQLYRFPSILLFDLATIWGISGSTSWETADMLHAQGKISSDLHGKLTYLLACACHIRLSAYLHHDSHDDRISVAQRSATVNCESMMQCARRRLYLSVGLFSAMSDKLIPLKKDLAKMDTKNLEYLSIQDTSCRDCHLTRAQTFYSCGRYTKSNELLLELFGNDLLVNPQVVIQSIAAEKDRGLVYIVLVADILVQCSRYSPALQFSIYAHDREPNIKNVKRLADCYSGLSMFDEALQILLASAHKSGEIDLRLGEIYRKLERNAEAETYLVSALQKYCEAAFKEVEFDYYGTVITSKQHNFVDLANMSKKERLSHIRNPSIDVADAIASLQYFYFCQGQYEEADMYNEKYTNLTSELYGEEALVIGAVGALCKRGNNLFKKEESSKAEQIFVKSLQLCKEIYGDESIHVDIVVLYSNLGYCYGGMNQYEKAKSYFKKSLEMARELYGQQPNQITVSEQLRELGWCYNRTKEYEEANQLLLESLQMYRQIYGDESSLDCIADVITKIGINLRDMDKHEEALRWYSEALLMHEQKERSKHSDLRKAAVLANMGYGHHSMLQFPKAEQCYMQSLTLYQGHHTGDDEMDVANLCFAIGDNLKAQEKYSDAVNFYSKSLSIKRNVLSTEAKTESLAAVLRNHGVRYSTMRMYAEAELFFAESLKLLKGSKLKERHESAAVILRCLGSNSISQGDYDKANQYFIEALGIYRKVEKAHLKHHAVAGTLNCLGLTGTEKG